MKKFLKKKPVLVTFLTAAIIFLVIYTSLLVRPGTTFTPYEGKNDKLNTEYQIVFKGGKKADIKTVTTVGSLNNKTEQEVWVHFDSYQVYINPLYTPKTLNKEDFIEVVDDLEDDLPKTYELSLNKVNVFKMEYAGVELVNTGAIVFAIVGGVVELILIGFAAMSIVASTSKKKKRK